ncbi:universal stress protein [Streptomyces phytophilus]|uniref:universal stress protein n=1 Tax=Streptomyces phytophilus TaxID=722715 RepID=UPI0015F10A22|nr:universal stress protein [Streptomyces phytophilus]
MAARHVVVGVDGSDPSMAAVRWAAAEAASRRISLRIVHAEAALSGNRQAAPAGSLHDEWVRDRIAHACRETAERYPEVEISGGATTETAVKALLDAARDEELLVLGSRGIGAASGFFTGSVALPVVAHATGPTVLVRQDWHPDTADLDLPVVAGVDLDHGFDPVLEFAFGTAHRTGSVLRVVHMWRRSSVYAYPSALPDPKVGTDLKAAARDRLDSAIDGWQARYPDVVTERALLDGEVAPGLLEEAAGARLLVGGRRMHKRLSFPTLIGPVTHVLMHHAIAPVAVVPHE